MVAKRSSAKVTCATAGVERTDLLPWAAYVLGHHPFTLHGWLAGWWMDCFQSGMVLRKVLQQGRRTVVEMISGKWVELEEALATFGQVEHLRGDHLSAFAQDMERCKNLAEETLDDLAVHAPDESWLPEEEEWALLQGGQVRLVPLSAPELLGWRRLGETIGRCQRHLRLHTPWKIDDLPVELYDLERQAGDPACLPDETVRRRTSRVAERIRVLYGVDGKLDDLRNLCVPAEELSWLDESMRRGLRRFLQPWLVLEDNSITFRGVRKDAKEIRRSEWACLRVLARHAGKQVERTVLIKEAGLESRTDEYGLKFMMARLRKALRNLFGEPASRLILSRYGRNQMPGPYQLNLPAERVRIQDSLLG